MNEDALIDSQISVLVNILKQAPGWVPSRRLSVLAGQAGFYIHPRKIGEIASLLEGAVIGGGLGYKYALHATPKEILDCYSADMKRSMGTEQRARKLIHFARKHRLLGAAGADENLNQLRMTLEKEIAAGNESAKYLDDEGLEADPFHSTLIKPVEKAKPVGVTIFLTMQMPNMESEDFSPVPLGAYKSMVAAQRAAEREAQSTHRCILPAPIILQGPPPQQMIYLVEAPEDERSPDIKVVESAFSAKELAANFISDDQSKRMREVQIFDS